MERDMDFVRAILLKVEADPNFNGTGRPASAALGVEGHTDQELIYHLVMLIDEAGFLEGNTKLSRQGVVVVSKLTWKGHEFLDDTRDPEIWRKAKERAKGVVGIGMGFLWEIAKAEVRAKLGLP